MGLAASKQEAFWEACGFGHTQRVKKFIEEGCDVNWVSYTHNSCAIHVASQGKEEIVQMLINAKCDINVKDDRGNLALHHAAMKGHGKIMQMLIDAGSEINTQDKNGWTPLLNAAYFCQPDAIEVLLKNNCDVNIQTKDLRHALHEACRSQSRDKNGLAIIACHLVEAGCDIDAKSSDIGEADFTPLMFASYHGHAEVAEVLAEAKCEINAQGSNGWTALHWAADRGHMDVIRVLLEWGIDPLITGRRGELAVDRVQDNELKEMLADVTSQAKSLHDQDMTSRSPVSTTSPLSSSRSTSLGSGMEADNDQDQAVHNVIDNDLAAKLQAVAMTQDLTEKEAESSCTSGTISEKDEKETLEKDVSDNSPSCESLPEDNTLISGSSETSKETVAMAIDDVETADDAIVMSVEPDKNHEAVSNDKCVTLEENNSVCIPHSEGSEMSIGSGNVTDAQGNAAVNTVTCNIETENTQTVTTSSTDPDQSNTENVRIAPTTSNHFEPEQTSNTHTAIQKDSTQELQGSTISDKDDKSDTHKSATNDNTDQSQTEQ